MKKLWMILLMVTVLALSGCMYPDSERSGSTIPYEEQLRAVQSAVEQYQENSGGLLPIKTRDQDVDAFIKYPIDFSKIVPAHLEKIPSNAYETGGIYQYVIIDVEENPTVKLVDLNGPERIRELNLRKSVNGHVPIEEMLTKDVFLPNFSAMGLKEAPTVKSPYSDRELPIILSSDGNFYIDYTADLHDAVADKKADVESGEDIRHILYDENPILPAYSLPYTVDEEDNVIFMTEK
ncbi:hypothetical protein SAMN04488126_10483 [Bhargavaea beijingensis]|uniref:Uncharacterized protein n=1 Tax=Bhargavaea beijingensis TaxID=426756 RepID=A0A1G7AP77_9BACL|nr:hypothetical protein [Bhargavaea beijingensis]SDE15805.1 hypothetical protein SAMN04488126_10483 [Bhargavaea beijingensis]